MRKIGLRCLTFSAPQRLRLLRDLGTESNLYSALNQRKHRIWFKKRKNRLGTFRLLVMIFLAYLQGEEGLIEGEQRGLSRASER